MKVDVYKLEQRYHNWKDEVLRVGVPGLTPRNSALLIRYVLDMEVGRNIARGTKRGGRSYTQLVNLAQRLKQILKLLQAREVPDVRALSENAVTELFADMERGRILTRRGTPYASTDDYVRVFKAFWHWWIKVNRKDGNVVPDITEDLSARRASLPKFVYLKKADVDAMLPFFDPDEQVLLLFLFDSVIRSPTEVLSLRVQDIYESEGEAWVNIPDVVSKTFGRTFNLLYCGEALREYIARSRRAPEDPLFQFSPPVLNRKLKRVAAQVLGDRVSHPEGDRYSNLTLYDFRHSGAIHFRILAKDNPDQISLDAVRHRAGWTDFSMLNYYTRFIGIDGRIAKRGMLLRQDRHHLEEEVSLLREELKAIRKQNRQILEGAEVLAASRGKPVALSNTRLS